MSCRPLQAFLRATLLGLASCSAVACAGHSPGTWVSPTLYAFVSAPQGSAIRSTIIGHVTRGAYGQACSGVVVVLRRVDAPELPAQTVLTDQDGIFAYTELSAGSYEIAFYGLDGAGHGLIRRQIKVGSPHGTILVDARWVGD